MLSCVGIFFWVGTCVSQLNSQTATRVDPIRVLSSSSHLVHAPYGDVISLVVWSNVCVKIPHNQPDVRPISHKLHMIICSCMEANPDSIAAIFGTDKSGNWSIIDKR